MQVLVVYMRLALRPDSTHAASNGNRLHRCSCHALIGPHPDLRTLLFVITTLVQHCFMRTEPRLDRMGWLVLDMHDERLHRLVQANEHSRFSHSLDGTISVMS